MIHQLGGIEVQVPIEKEEQLLLHQVDFGLIEAKFGAELAVC